MFSSPPYNHILFPTRKSGPPHIMQLCPPSHCTIMSSSYCTSMSSSYCAIMSSSYCTIMSPSHCKIMSPSHCTFMSSSHCTIMSSSSTYNHVFFTYNCSLYHHRGFLLTIQTSFLYIIIQSCFISPLTIS